MIEDFTESNGKTERGPLISFRIDFRGDDRKGGFQEVSLVLNPKDQ